jgi:predicted nuclease with TOPRIM domain
LIEQYNQRQEPGYGTPEQQEQQRLKRRLSALQREGQRLIDAYQSGVIEPADLKERRERITEECRRMDERLSSLRQQQQEQQRHAALATTVEEFCRGFSIPTSVYSHAIGARSIESLPPFLLRTATTIGANGGSIDVRGCF